MRAWLIGSTTLRPAARHPVEKPEAAGHRTPLLGASAALACLLGLPAIARADFVPPPGVTDYRLIFVTADGTSATSANIADYNSFATSEAALNPDLPSTTWTAVVSTDQVDAVSNIACTPDCSNIPIFLVDGTEVAPSSTALFNAATVSLLHGGIDEDQNGNGTGGYVWTGSFSDGTANIQTFGQDTFDSTMGNGGPVEVGFSGNTDGTAIAGGPFFVGDSPDDLTEEPIYAISGVISTPEPETISLLAFGGIMTGLAARFRRRRKSATGG
ncbi:MAG TPA: PEP-CTERM sorting domain-containing protein [Rhodopila sp.]